jgi:hypothetical protein
MAKKAARKRRRGFSSIARDRQSPAAIRRAEMAEAEEKYPVLLRKLAKIKVELRKNRASGRFEYLKSLRDIYALVWKWDVNGKLESLLEIIVKLRGVPSRDNANRFSALVAYCYDSGERTREERDRDRKTVSRWSQQLDVAFEQETHPNKLIDFLNAESSSKRTSSEKTK